MHMTVLSPWLRRQLEILREVDHFQATHPMADATVDEIEGRRLRIGDHWLDDFASCNYLGFDLDPAIIDGVGEYLHRWGTHPSWARLVASPVLFEQIESEVRDLLGAEDVLTLPTLTHIHSAVIPLLARGGTILLDNRSHRTLHDACFLAKVGGTKLRRFRTDDLEQVEHLLRRDAPAPKLIVMDGINSMTGNPPDLPALAALAREHDALLYVDDAHGFGLIGERTPNETSPYGSRGNAIVRHMGESYDNVILTAGFSKAYSSLLAFIACPSELKRLLKVAAGPYTYSGPSPIASLATAQLGLKANANRGDELRATIWHHTDRVLQRLDKLGVATPNTSGFPVVEVLLADPGHAEEVGHRLFQRGIYVTLAIYPVVPRNATGFRIQITAVNTDQQIRHLIGVIEDIHDEFGLKPNYA
jgi:8-amino-7-oxononanoate synthase